ncbi:MAG: hypothetical protein ABI760_05560 [Ferruginibacter sp.]
MNTNINKFTGKAVVEQITNNTTSWIGHHKIDNKDIIGGQTFISPSDVDLEAIEVFTSIVTTPGKVLMTLHPFDTILKSWGPVLGSASVDFNRADNGKWKSFIIPGLHLNKGKAYGFRLESTNSYIGVGETVGSYDTPPIINGQEWKFTGNDKKGQSYSYFSLAFRVEARA